MKGDAIEILTTFLSLRLTRSLPSSTANTESYSFPHPHTVALLATQSITCSSRLHVLYIAPHLFLKHISPCIPFSAPLLSPQALTPTKISTSHIPQPLFLLFSRFFLAVCVSSESEELSTSFRWFASSKGRTSFAYSYLRALSWRHS